MMNRKLTIRELQSYELLLSSLNRAVKNNFHFQFIVKDENLILSGNFFLYDEQNNPGIRKNGYAQDLYTLESLSDIFYDDDLLQPIIRHFPPHNGSFQDRCKMVLSHLPEFFKYCDKEGSIDKCKTHPQLSILDGDNQYMFDVKILDVSNLPQLDFYRLDIDKTYDLLSIVTTTFNGNKI